MCYSRYRVHVLRLRGKPARLRRTRRAGAERRDLYYGRDPVDRRVDVEQAAAGGREFTVQGETRLSCHPLGPAFNVLAVFSFFVLGAPCSFRAVREHSAQLVPDDGVELQDVDKIRRVADDRSVAIGSLSQTPRRKSR